MKTLLSLFTIFTLLLSPLYATEKIVSVTFTKEVIEPDLKGFTIRQYRGGNVTEHDAMYDPVNGLSEINIALDIPAGTEEEVCYTVDAYDTSNNHSEETPQTCVILDCEAPTPCTALVVTILK